MHIFLTSALAGGVWSASHPGRFTPGEGAPGTHWIGGWVDPRTGLDDVENRKYFTLPGLEIRPLGCQPVASCYTDYAIPAPHNFCTFIIFPSVSTPNQFHIRPLPVHRVPTRA
jgi:hypothetical protein